MADVKWIKFMVGTFDGSSFKRIKKATLKDGTSYRDRLTAIWFELLDLAGNKNLDGMLVDKNDLELPYDAESQFEDIATMIDRPASEVECAIAWFVKNKMIIIVDSIYCLSNWSKYQSIQTLDDVREKNRERQKRYYERQKSLASNDTPNAIPNVSITSSNAPRIKNKNKNKEEEIEKEYIKDIKERDTKNVANAPALPIFQQNESNNSSEKTRTYFKKPTVEEVEAYCKERKNVINPQAFVDFYEAKNWFIGKTKMKDWKACVRTWESRDFKGKPAKAPGKYEQENRAKDIMEGMDVL